MADGSLYRALIAKRGQVLTEGVANYSCSGPVGKAKLSLETGQPRNSARVGNPRSSRQEGGILPRPLKIET